MDIDFFFALLFFLYLFIQLFSILFKYLSLPKVVGEIVGGIVFSSFSVLITPFFKNGSNINPNNHLDVLYWLGVVFLMFVSGYEISVEKTKASMQTNKTLIISILTLIIPFFIGYFSADSLVDFHEIKGANFSPLVFKIIFGIASSIVSIPVIGRIFQELNILNTVFASDVISISTIHDVILWALLSFIINTSNLSTITFDNRIVYDLILFVIFWAFCILLVPSIVSYFKTKKISVVLKKVEALFFFIVLLSFLVMSHLLNIHITFCAFLAGIFVSNLNGEGATEIKQNIKFFSDYFLIPLYFGIVGYRIQINSFSFTEGIVSSLIFLATIQGLVVFGLMYFLTKNKMKSLDYSLALNAKGGPTIIVADLTFNKGIINSSFHFNLILLSLITSTVAGAWLKFRAKSGYLGNENLVRNHSERV